MSEAVDSALLLVKILSILILILCAVYAVGRLWRAGVLRSQHEFDKQQRLRKSINNRSTKQNGL